LQCWPIAMFRLCRPATWHRRQALESIELVIEMFEDHVAWTATHSVRLAAAGRAADASYARALLDLGQLYLNLLRQSRCQLLARERPGIARRAAIESSPFNALLLRAGAGPHRVSPVTLLMRGAGGDLGRKLPDQSSLT
jgi:hypothetical protein